MYMLTGLFGVTRAIAFVREFMRFLHFATEGKNPSSADICSNTGVIPRRVKVILRPFISKNLRCNNQRTDD